MCSYEKHMIATIDDNKSPKLNFKEQIEFLRDKKGVRFDLIDEDDAIDFLKYHNYFFKLKAYRKNYNTYSDGKYHNLDFKYLIELSTLDMHLREIIIKMALNIEHYLKVQMLRDVAEDDKVDAYNIVNRFFSSLKPNLKEDIKKKAKNSYCKDLIDKRIDSFALWDVVEVLSFGDFVDLYNLFYSEYDYLDGEKMKDNLKAVQWLRNAAAHNNCILNNLRVNDYMKPNRTVCQYISDNIKEIKSGNMNKKMKTKSTHDFIVTLYVFNMVVTSQKIKYSIMAELKNLFDNRMVMNASYFKDNAILLTNYEFAKKIVDHFYSLCYHT